MAHLIAAAAAAVVLGNALPAEHDGVALRFRPPVTIDWESLAPESVACIAKGTCDHELCELWERKSFNGLDTVASVEFDVPLPKDLAPGHYAYLSASGLEPIRPTHLRGRLVVSFGRRMVDDVARISRYEGFVVAEGASADTMGGFVIRTDRKLQVVRFPATRSINGYWGREEVSEPSDAVTTLYEFSLGEFGERFAFAEWRTDHLHSGVDPNVYYEIFAAHGTPKRVAEGGHRSRFVDEERGRWRW